MSRLVIVVVTQPWRGGWSAWWVRVLCILALFVAGCSNIAERGPKGDEGERGPRGEHGKTGERGAQGPRGQLGQSRVVDVTQDVQTPGYGAAEVSCGEGETFVAGGCEWGKTGDDFRPIAGRPISDEDGDAIGWTCTGIAIVPTTIKAFALCADGAP